MKFKVILADPPWGFGRGKVDAGRKNKKGGPIKNPDAYYACMSFDSLAKIPVHCVAHSDCALLMWTTWAHVKEAIGLMDAWGFCYKAGLPWIKMTNGGYPRRGIGFHVSNCSEPLLIGIKGSVPVPGPSELGLIETCTGDHSEKPFAQYKLAERYPGPYLELFARKHYFGQTYPLPNWTFVGNEIDGKDINDALKELAEK